MRKLADVIACYHKILIFCCFRCVFISRISRSMRGQENW